jgi:hypothetical protein
MRELREFLEQFDSLVSFAKFVEVGFRAHGGKQAEGQGDQDGSK